MFILHFFWLVLGETKFCDRWAKSGECKRNPKYMLKQCQRSCNQCTGIMHYSKIAPSNFILQMAQHYSQQNLLCHLQYVHAMFCNSNLKMHLNSQFPTYAPSSHPTYAPTVVPSPTPSLSPTQNPTRPKPLWGNNAFKMWGDVMEHRGMFSQENDETDHETKRLQQSVMRKAMRQIHMKRFIDQLSSAHDSAANGKSCSEVQLKVA